MESSYFAQLPTTILLSPDLTCFQKLLYADIQSLTFQRGYCWATNKFLAERHDKSKEHISRQLSKLIEYHHLFIIDNKGGNNSIGKRKIFTESTFILYAQEKGLNIDNFKVDKNIKAGSLKIDKNIKVISNISKNISKQELPKGNSPASGQVFNHTVGTKKRDALKQVKKPTVAQTKHVHPETIEILAHWNSFDSLTTHSLKQKRTVAPLHEQTKTIQNIDCAIYKVLRGTFYSKHEGIQAGLKKKVWNMASLKKAIEHMALACTPDYSTNSKRISLINFLFNPHVDLGTGKNKYRYKYPFLHFINNKPVTISSSPTRKKTEYPILVDRTIKNLTGTIKPTDKEYNQVVKQIDKAIIFIKKVSNGNFSENRMKLPLMLKDTMLENKLSLTVENLPLGVYNLEKFMRKRLMIGAKR